MMKLAINSITMENFKSFKDVTVEFNERTQIKGPNACGKTTIVDAFFWVLFNTDSKGNAPGSDKFREKPLDENGQEIHNLETTVTLDCVLNGMPFVLRRTQKEIWAKARRIGEDVYKGNESQYWINGLEVKLSDFKARVSEIAPMDVLELLTNLGEFNRRDWKSRRAVLLKMCSRDVDTELLARPQYKEVAKQVRETGVGADNQPKLAKERITNLTAQLKQLPTRIDEATRLLPDVDPQKLSTAQYMIEDVQKDLANIETYIADAKAEAAGSNARMAIKQLEAEAEGIKRELAEDLRAKRKEAQTEKDAAEMAINRLKAYKDSLKARLDGAEWAVKNNTQIRDSLRDDFARANAEVIERQTVCETCGQTLPEEMVEEVYQNRLKAKADKKNAIRERGKAAAEILDKARVARDELATEIGSVDAQMEGADKRLKEAEAKLAGIPITPDYSDNAALNEIAEQIRALNTDTVGYVDDKVAGLERRKLELQEQLKRNQAIVLQYETADTTRKRIEELKGEQEARAKELAAAERYLELAEQFIRDRCDLLTDSINALFPTVRWKLFNEQINGGITDVCTCQIPCAGSMVAYESANTASQINADIEIIKVLSDEYEVKMPLFVDNAERVLNLADAGTQTITLSVSEGELIID